MKTLRIRHKREIAPIVFIGLILFVSLSGKQHCDLFPCESIATQNEELFRQDVEPCSEPDSGTDKSNMKATSAFMIGLPF
ncbi:hypothetical protein [Marinilabilia salmonicolor]|uniref:hypothetical protein n=1 Tax=Marinilabilia salmonicolor TaxID=989 RepID=UPI00029A9B54|nr:hypothetical protein [Marinilabilia salmonicolor]